MVKATPKIRSNNLARRRRKIMELHNQKKREALLLHFAPKSTPQTPGFLSASPPAGNNLHLHQQQTATNSIPKPRQKPLESPLTPHSSAKKRRSRSPISTYATCSSSSPPNSPSSLSSPFSPHFLRRTVSGPPVIFSDSSAQDSSTSKKIRKITHELNHSSPICRNLMGQLLPPLPPQPSPKLLRRTVSDPVPLLSQSTSISKEKKGKEEMREQSVRTEKLSSDWIMIKLKCGCGCDIKFLFNAAEHKCYKLV